MSLTAIPSDFVASFKAREAGDFTEVVFFRGYRLGTVDEIRPGVSSASTKTGLQGFFARSGITWRAGWSAGLLDRTAIKQGYDRAGEVSLDLYRSAASVFLDAAGSDVVHAVVREDLPTTKWHGILVDHAVRSTIPGNHGWEQAVTPAGSRASETWTFSVHLAPTDPNATTGPTCTLHISLGDATEVSTASAVVPGKWQRFSITKTFSAAPTSKTVVVKVIPPLGAGVLLAAAQLERAASASQYERVGAPLGYASAVEKLTNGGLDTWSSSTNATGWTEITTGGTVNQENTAKVGATGSAARLTRTGAGALSLDQTGFTFTPGKWAIVSVWIRGSASITGGAKVVLRNVTLGRDLQDDGAWNAGTGFYALQGNVTTTYRRFTLYFFVPATFGGGDSYTLSLTGDGIAASQSVYYDVASLFGMLDDQPVGARNVLVESHFPTRFPWYPTDATVSGTAGIGRPAEWKITVPWPGCVDFGIGRIGPAVSDGRALITPYDQYGKVSDTLTHNNAAISGGVHQTVTGLSPAGKMYLFSGWVRKKRGVAAPAGGIVLQVQPRDSGNNNLGSITSPLFTLTEVWRRVWWNAFVSSSLTTADRVLVFAHSPVGSFALNDAWEIFGLQLEEYSGDVARLPQDFEPTTTAAGAINMLLHSSDLANAIWGKQAGTLASNDGYAPIEYYDVFHPERGTSPTRVRVNPWRNPTLDWQFTESAGSDDPRNGAGDGIEGALFTVGAYGPEKLTDGHWNTWASGAPSGWTWSGAVTTTLAQLTVRSEYWEDDDEATSGRSAAGITDTRGVVSTPEAWLEKTAITLNAGWHTFHLRCSRKSSGGRVGIALRRISTGLWMRADGVRWTAAAQEWIASTPRIVGSDQPNYGEVAFFVFIPAAGTYDLRVGSWANPLQVFLDQAKLLENAGALYASPADRTETDGALGFETQGLYVTFGGIVDDRPRSSDIQTTLRCTDYLTAIDTKLPIRMVRPECQWKFGGNRAGDGISVGGCGYVKTTDTTAVAQNNVTTVNCLDTSRLRAGRSLRLDDLSTRTILTVLSGTQFTIDVAATFPASTPIAYGDCRRTYPDCDLRQRTFRYGGYRAVAYIPAFGSNALLSRVYTGVTRQSPKGEREREIPPGSGLLTGRYIGSLTIDGDAETDRQTIFESRPVPRVYGRKTVKLTPIERNQGKIKTGSLVGKEYNTVFYLIGEGPIEGIRRILSGDSTWGHAPGSGAATGLGTMLYWRRGDVGVDDWETEAEWYANMGAGNTALVNLLRTQNRSFRTNTDTAYSETAVLEVALPVDSQQVDPEDPSKVPDLWADLQALRVQKYDAYGQPLGAKVWSQNPIWIWVDAMISGGVPKKALNFGLLVTAAAACDVEITSDEGRTTFPATLGSSKVHRVAGVSGFAPEMAAEVLDANGAFVASVTIDLVDAAAGAITFKAALSVTAGYQLQAKPFRYTCNVVLDRQMSLKQASDMILATCRGAVVMDGGKLGVRIESSSDELWQFSSDATGTAFQGTLIDSVAFNTRRTFRQSNNVIEAVYESGQSIIGANRMARLVDADRGGLDFPRPVRFDVRGAETADQAVRAVLPKYARVSANEEGFTFRTGLAGHRCQVGERATLVRAGQAYQNVRIGTKSILPNLAVELACVPEASTLRLDGWAPQISPYTDNPLSGAEAGSGLATPIVAAAVAKAEEGRLEVDVTITGHAAGPGASAGDFITPGGFIELHASASAGFQPTTGDSGIGGTLVARISSTSRRLTWVVPESRIETLLYCRVVWLSPGGVELISSEFSTKVYRTTKDTTDPTQQEQQSPFNLVYGSDYDPDTQALSATDGTGKWITDSSATFGADIDPTANSADGSVGTGAGFSNPTQAYDETAATSDCALTASGVGDVQEEAHIWDSFGAGTKDAKVRVEAYKTGTHAGFGSLILEYATDKTSPTWIQFATVIASAAGTEYETPVLLAQDMSKLAIRAKARIAAGISGAARSFTAKVNEINANERTSTIEGSVSDNQGHLKGDGTSYGNLRRRFPGKLGSPVSAVVMAAGGKFAVRLKARKTGGAPTNPVEVVLFNESTSTRTVLLTIPASELTTSMQDFVQLFTAAASVSGVLWIETRCKDAVQVDVDQVEVKPGTMITAYSLSVEEISEGKSPDQTHGISGAFTRGAWGASPKTAAVS